MIFAAASSSYATLECVRACYVAGLYREGDWLLFGAETTGLPEEVRGNTLEYSAVHDLDKCICNRLSDRLSTDINCFLLNIILVLLHLRLGWSAWDSSTAVIRAYHTR